MSGELPSVADPAKPAADADRLLDGLAAFAMIADIMTNRTDAGRWGAGLVRRSVSVALLLLALTAEAAMSWRDRARYLLESLDPTTPLRHLARPPARWTAA